MLVLFAVAAIVVIVVARSGAAVERSGGAERGRSLRTILAAAGVLAIVLFLMKGAGFVAGVGLLLPLAALGVLAAVGFAIARGVRGG